MKLGKVTLLPFFLPGDPAMADAVRGLAGKRSAVMLATHGPVVTGRDVGAACNAIEELEETARLAMMTPGFSPRMPIKIRKMAKEDTLGHLDFVVLWRDRCQVSGAGDMWSPCKATALERLP